MPGEREITYKDSDTEKQGSWTEPQGAPIFRGQEKRLAKEAEEEAQDREGTSGKLAL